MKSLKYKSGVLKLIDQTKLPEKLEYIECSTYKDVGRAITGMVVRGAPLIGVCAAYGISIGAAAFKTSAIKSSSNKTISDEFSSKEEFFDNLRQICVFFKSTRPTAVNLFWSVDRIYGIAVSNKAKSINEIKDIILKEAQTIESEDISTNRAIGKNGDALIRQDSTILTHCNTGSLATCAYGTALGVIRSAHESGKNINVIVDETRPYLQGSRLTAWELKQDNIPFKLICDNMSGHFMRLGKIDCVIVGADRIASNGDTANKIGTYALAVLAHENNIPFYVAAPTSTIDFTIENGDAITIEERDSKEITHIKNLPIAPEGIDVLNPAFDMTPNRYISAIITEKGVTYPPFDKNLGKLI
ncbi:MAG: S-methyl-5-thioribose-1-phosphate isomerase [Clostridia bacterium]